MRPRPMPVAAGRLGRGVPSRAIGRLLAACDQLEVLEDHYSPGCMLRRNREMLRRAQLLISVFDGTPSGTAATVRLAEELGIEGAAAVDVSTPKRLHLLEASCQRS